MHFLRPDPLCQSVTPKPLLTVRDYWLLALMTTGALILRLIGLNEGLWFDEIVTLIYYVPLPVQKIMQLHDGRNNHIFYSIMAHFSWSWLGESAWSIRLPAALLGTATIPAAYYLGLQLASRREALLASVFLLASYHHVWYSQSARGYSGVLFASVLLSIVFIRLLYSQKPPWSMVALYAIIAALATWIHLTAAMIVIAHALIWLGLLLKNWRGGIDRINLRVALAILFSGLISIGLNAGVIQSQTAEYIAPVAKRAAAAAKATAVAAVAAASSVDLTGTDDAAPNVTAPDTVAAEISGNSESEPAGVAGTSMDQAVDTSTSQVADDSAETGEDTPTPDSSDVVAGAVALPEPVTADDVIESAEASPDGATMRQSDPAAAAALAAKRIGRIIVAPSTPSNNWMLKEVALALSLAVPGGKYVLPVLALVLVFVLGAGLWSYARQGWLSLAILTAPFFVIVAIFVLLSELMFPRFLLSCAVFLLLLGVRGGYVLTNSLVPSVSTKQVTAIGLVLALVSALAVPQAWQPKQDFQDAFDFIQANVQSDDAVVCSKNMYYMFRYYLDLDCERLENGRELAEIEAGHARTWYVHTLQFNSRNTRLWRKLKRHYVIEKVASSTVNRGEIYILLNDGSAAAE